MHPHPRSPLDLPACRTSSSPGATVDQEVEAGLRSIAAPIHDGAGAVVAAVDLSTQAPSNTVTEMRRRLPPPLRITAEAIERDLAAR